MSNKITPKDNQSNQSNPNKGANGTNTQYDKAQGNKGKQVSKSQEIKKEKNK